jgi:hypothetical protein
MTMGSHTVEVFDIPYGERNIWGATAGMLLTLRRLLQARAGTEHDLSPTDGASPDA